jgi:putative radical SAM enzyme (TIGR03279 family)
LVRVEAVAKGSLGAELGLVPGTELVAVDGREVEDFLDWEFLTAEDRFVLHARLPGGAGVEYDVERPEGVPLGVRLEAPRIRRCANHCDFCFVDGNPTGLRSVLYIRDDDYRLSFRYGNFATLTNLKPWDVRRIIEYRLSPLYVSVHATDPLVRRWLLRNPEAPEIVPQLRMFGDHGIRFHAQVVLLPGVNDGPQLARTLGDLYGLGDTVVSVSVVPVALTEFSKHHLVRPPAVEECRAALRAVDRVAGRSVAERGHPWCFGADELYLRAGEPLPAAEWYRDFDQRENGVGAVRYLETRIEQEANRLPGLRGRRVGVVTGTAMGPLLPQVLDQLARRTGATFELLPLENTLFGPAVTSAGLLPGAAIRDALCRRPDLHLGLLPAESVNDDLQFLDGVEAEALAAAVPMAVTFSYDFVDALSQGEPWARRGAALKGGDSPSPPLRVGT